MLASCSIDLSRFKRAIPMAGYIAEEVRLSIVTDFDGTITTKDALRLLLEEFTGRRWAVLREQLDSGEVFEKEALPLCFKNFPIDLDEATSFVLKNVELDPSFKPFVAWARERSCDLQILSGGFSNFIQPLLAKHQISGVHIRSNSVTEEKRQWVINPYSCFPICPRCSNCKAQTVLMEKLASPRSQVVYIGDGVTDVCAIQLADLVFAKGTLQTYCIKNNIKFVPFESFAGIQSFLTVRYFQNKSQISQKISTPQQSRGVLSNVI